MQETICTFCVATLARNGHLELREFSARIKAAAPIRVKARDLPSFMPRYGRPELTTQKKRTRSVDPIATRFHVKYPLHLLCEPPRGSYGYCAILGSIVGLLGPLIVIVEPLRLRLSAVEWASGPGLGDALAGGEKEGEESLELAGSVVAGIFENSRKRKMKVRVQVVVFGAGISKIQRT